MRKLLILLILAFCLQLAAQVPNFYESEGNNDYTIADPIPADTFFVYVHGTAETGAEDWFSFVLNDGDRLDISITNPGITIEFLDATRITTYETLTSVDNSGNFQAPSDGDPTLETYYMKVSGGSETPYVIYLENLDNETLPVTFSSFNASPTAEGSVKLDWTVESETEMLGYNLLRSTTTESQNAVNINANTIPALNLPNQHSYSFEDIDVETNSTYYYWIESIEINNNVTYHGPVRVLVTPKGDDNDKPEYYQLTKIHRNYPNPFNPHTVISYSIKGYSNEQVPVTMAIYNIRGQKVSTLLDGHVTPGDDKIDWFGKDDKGNDCSSGVYFFVLKTPDTVTTSKMTLLK